MSTNRKNKLGFVYVVISQILFLMASISTVHSTTTYYIQLVCFCIFSFTGFIFGIAYVLGQTFAGSVLSWLSWIGFIYFTGAGVLGLIIALLGAIQHSLKDLLFLVGIGFVISAQGIPFFILARKFGNTAKPENRSDGGPSLG